jgi:hypothetical protein
MTENKISIIIPPEVYTQAVQKLTELQTLLQPYLIALTPEDRRALPKMGDKTLAFVSKSLDYAEINANLLPAFMDLAEWQKDNTANTQTNALYRLAQQLTSNLDDTAMLSGSESYTASLGFYNNVKQAAKMNVPGAKAVWDDLSQRFPGRTITPQPAAQTANG